MLDRKGCAAPKCPQGGNATVADSPGWRTSRQEELKARRLRAVPALSPERQLVGLREDSLVHIVLEAQIELGIEEFVHLVCTEHLLHLPRL